MTQKEAIEILKMGKNVFVTGPAGSGKTHLINQYIAYLKSNNVDIGITASTGIAATHMGGVTIHSWSGMGIKSVITENDLEAMEERQYLWKRFESVKVLIIDEVSMLHHFRFDILDTILKRMKRNELPFGGIQVVLCGDFFQLPPVTRLGEPPAHFIYKAEAWKRAGFLICYLSEQYRQSGDDAMLSILNEIRAGEVSDESRESLKERFNVKTIEGVEPTKLFTHNVDVDTQNDTELGKLIEGEVEYYMETVGRDTLVESLKKSCLAPEVLRLKVGARIMCVKNNPQEGYANGTLGVIVSCKPNQNPVIRIAGGKLITIEQASWKIEEEGKVKAELAQYPLRLAWAITVHKSQGMSLDAIEVDLSKSFQPGMGYVALSRVRTIEGLTIIGINEAAFGVHQEVLEYDRTLKEKSDETLDVLDQLKPVGVRLAQEEFLKSILPKQKEKKPSTYEMTAELVRGEKSLDEMAKARSVTRETIIAHLESLIEEGIEINIKYLKKEISSAHFPKIKKALEEVFEKTGTTLLSPVKEKLGATISYQEIRLARVLLGYTNKKLE
jgi:hypothetical protein